MSWTLKWVVWSKLMTVTSWHVLLLLVTSSLACNIQFPRKTLGVVVNSTGVDDHHGPGDTRFNATGRDGALLPSSYSLPLSIPSLQSNIDDEGIVDMAPDQQNKTLRSSSSVVPKTLGKSGKGRDVDLTTLLVASSPGDVLNEDEINDFIQTEGMWSATRKAAEEEKAKAVAASIYYNGTVTRKMYQRFSGAVVYIAFPLTIVGFVTNVIALKVFRKLPKNVTNTYMMVLICFDMTYLLFVVCSRIVVMIIRASGSSSTRRHFLQLYVIDKFFILSARQIIIMTTAYMSLDRYFAIAFPFGSHNAVLRRPKVLVLVTALLILAFNSHKPLKREVIENQPPGSNHSVWHLTYSQLYVENHGLLDDLSIASSCLFQYLPLLATLVANLALISYLYRHSSLHRYAPSPSPSSPAHRHSQALPDVVAMEAFSSDLPAHQSSPTCTRHHTESCSTIVSRNGASSVRVDSHFYQLERHLCFTVVAYSCFFFLLSLPLALLPALKKAFPEFNVFRSQHYMFLIYVRVFPLLDIISASINFFVFFIKGGAFRAGVYRLLGCRKYGRRKGAVLRLRSMESESTALTQQLTWRGRWNSLSHD